MRHKKLLLFPFFMVFVLLSSFVKLSFVFGCRMLFFSGINFFLPLLGAFLGGFFSSLCIICFFIYKFICGKSIITLGIPSCAASLVWHFSFKKDSKFFDRFFNFSIRVLLPLVCMILFILHSVGKKSFLYSFYWLIPIFLYFWNWWKNSENIFNVALTSTFVAHAVGSVMWIYLIPTTPLYWNFLKPIVFFERVVFAVGMYFIYVCILKMSDIFIYEPKAWRRFILHFKEKGLGGVFNRACKRM